VVGVTDTEKGRLMDAPMIVSELGVTRAVAEKIVRWCAKRGGIVRPVDGTRKAYVYRIDVDAWLEQSTEVAA
jgi:ribosomal protein S25